MVVSPLKTPGLRSATPPDPPPLSSDSSFQYCSTNITQRRTQGRGKEGGRVEAPQKWVELWSQRLYYLSAFRLFLSLSLSLSLNFSPYALFRRSLEEDRPPLFSPRHFPSLWKTSYEKQYLGRGASLLIKESVDADVGWRRRCIREREPRWRRIKPALRSATSYLFVFHDFTSMLVKEREILEERKWQRWAHNSGSDRVPILNEMIMSFLSFFRSLVAYIYCNKEDSLRTRLRFNSVKIGRDRFAKEDANKVFASRSCPIIADSSRNGNRDAESRTALDFARVVPKHVSNVPIHRAFLFTYQ